MPDTLLATPVGMHWFTPHFEGSVERAAIPGDFFARLAARVRDGLFVRGKRVRANYVVDRHGRDHIRFVAADRLTAFKVGLNRVEVRQRGRNLQYSVTYWTWTLYVVLLGAAIAACGILCFVLLPAMRAEIAEYGFLGATIFWGTTLFFGFVWPWILTAMHKPHAARCLEVILAEELRTATRH